MSLKSIVLAFAELQKVTMKRSRKRKRSVFHIHSLLDGDEWELDELDCALRIYSDVDGENEFGETPLIRVLEHGNCSFEIVDLLIQYGADVNFMASCQRAPLPSALLFCTKANIIERLMNSYGDPSQLFYQRSLLCIAVEYCSFEVVEILLRFKCPLEACKQHLTALHCALTFNTAEASSHSFKQFLEKGMEENLFNDFWPDILCYALQRGELSQIKMLLEAGALLGDCRNHVTSLFCAALNGKNPFKADLVMLILNAGVDPCTQNNNHSIAIQGALRFKTCETEAIRLLIDSPYMNATQINEYNLLHFALTNSNCKIGVIKLLLEKGALVSKLNDNQEIPLHFAVRFSELETVKLILEYHSVVKAPIDVRNLNGETPMDIVLKTLANSDLVMILFLAGAKIEEKTLEIALDIYAKMKVEEKLNCLKLIMKIYLINCNTYHSTLFLVSQKCPEEHLLLFLRACYKQIMLMNRIYGYAFKRYIIGAEAFASDRWFDLNSILDIQPYQKFPMICDVISARVGKEAMVKRSENVKVFPKQGGSNLSLGRDILPKITKFLSEEDLLNFLQAISD